MAAAESRASGSSSTAAVVPISDSWASIRARWAMPATTTTSAAPGRPATRSTVSWNMERAPTSGRNCLGWAGREAGHRRAPDPPHMITG